MTWAYFGDPRYELKLADGFSRQPAAAKWRNKHPWDNMSFEQGMAENLYRVCKGIDWRGHPRRPDQDHVHVWVIGKPGWLDRAPSEIQAVTDGETDPAYRIVINGVGLPDLTNLCLHGWSHHRRASHLPNEYVYSCAPMKMKTRKDKERFRRASELILEALHDYYVRHGEAGSHILEALGLPYVFRGD